MRGDQGVAVERMRCGQILDESRQENQRFPENLGVTQKRIEADSQGLWPE